MKRRAKTSIVEATSGRFKTRLATATAANSARPLACEDALVVLQRESALAPVAVAHGVCAEAGVFLGAELPAGWAELLVEKAAIVSAHNPRFRSLLRQHGERGRDWLWAFMRHWLAALLKQQRPAFFSRLPEDFCRGRELPKVC